ncbi:hypothetical protein IFR05_011362 [Cadophora sp. M221]|nr:hypothetical protein IFR05_011362 [Cadophora sp. M221]
MLACKEARNTMHEAYSAKLGATAIASNSTVVEDASALEVASLHKRRRSSLAPQRVNYNDDIFYLVNGLYVLDHPQNTGRIDLASITTLMLLRTWFNDIVWNLDPEPRLQSLSAPKSIIIVDPKHFKERRTNHYGDVDNFGRWAVRTPTFFERFDKKAISIALTKEFHNWFDKRMKSLSKLKEVAVYDARFPGWYLPRDQER